MTRFFAAKASSAAGLVAIGFRLVANSLRLSAGGACPSRAASDALCRLRDSTPRLPPPSAAPNTPERVPSMSREPEPIHRAPVKAHDFSTQDAFDWVDPSLTAGMSAGHKRNCQRPHSASTLATLSSFPPVTVMGRRVALVCRVPNSPKRARPTPHKMPLTNLCNRLVVNEHPWDPPIRERLALTSLTAPSIAALCPARPCWGRNSETPGRRRVARRHPRPHVTRRLVPRAPAVTDALFVTTKAASVFFREASTHALAFSSAARAE
jgi:hypothetical protein